MIPGGLLLVRTLIMMTGKSSDADVISRSFSLLLGR